MLQVQAIQHLEIARINGRQFVRRALRPMSSAVPTS
jgi:hypothetical protein